MYKVFFSRCTVGSEVGPILVFAFSTSVLSTLDKPENFTALDLVNCVKDCMFGILYKEGQETSLKLDIYSSCFCATQTYFL